MWFILGDRLITLSKEYQRLYMKLLIIRWIKAGKSLWADNRITEDMQYVYRYGCYGRLTPEQMAGQLEPEYTPQRKERFVRIIHCVIIAVQVLLLVCSSHYQPLMLIYHQEYQSLEGILMGALLAGMAYTDARNKNDSYKYTKGVSMGPGFGD